MLQPFVEKCQVFEGSSRICEQSGQKEEGVRIYFMAPITKYRQGGSPCSQIYCIPLRISLTMPANALIAKVVKRIFKIYDYIILLTISLLHVFISEHIVKKCSNFSTLDGHNVSKLPSLFFWCNFISPSLKDKYRGWFGWKWKWGREPWLISFGSGPQ